MRRHIFTLFLLAVAAYAAIAQQPENAATVAEAVVRKTAASEKYLIHKAVFEALMKQHPAKVHYLSIDWKEPKSEFLKLFEGSGLEVKKGSASPDLPLIEECENGGKCKNLIGGRLWTSNLKYLTKDKVELAAGENPTNMGGTDCTYTLAREGEAWKIILVDRCMVS